MAATRSGAPTTPAAASKATKATKTTRASKAKGGKKRAPKAANRVQKPAATGRNKGYVYINNDSRTETSSRTASPDFIPKTPPPSGRQRVVAESPPPSNQEYERKIARLQRKLRERRQSSRHRRRSREDSESKSEDSEAGDRPRVLFLHYAGNKPFLTLYKHYPAVNLKYLKQIYFRNFQPSKSMALAHNSLAWSTTHKAKKSKDEVIPDPADIAELLRTFEVYTHAICFFTVRPYIALDLHEALIRYRIRLLNYNLIYRFDSVRIYHYTFIGNRILKA